MTTATIGSRAERLLSTDPDAFGVPEGREENWRFTPLARLGGLLQPLPDAIEPKVDVDAPAGVEVAAVPATDPLFRSIVTPADRVDALVGVGVANATVVRVPARTQIAEPIVVTITSAGSGYAHLIIDIGESASATVVLDHGGDGVLGGVTEIRVGDAARLQLVSVQDAAPGAVHVAAQGAQVGRDAHYEHLVVTLGGDLVRLTPSVRFTGPGGDVTLSGLFFTSGGQHHEHQLFVDHEQPHCRSRVTYKGALQGEAAHSVWVGDVLIGAEAVGTDTYELNRNLVLTDGARADSVPNLEIKTGEVSGAGHASATGRFDDEQLFYLQARGIPADAARRMVVRGFFAEVLDSLTHAPTRDRLAARIDALLDGA